MKARLLIVLAVCLALIGIAACGRAGKSSSGVNVATSMASIAERIPTDTPIPPTPTIPPEDIVKDLTGVQLSVEDFPEGFKAMSSADMAGMSMTPNTLAASLTNDLKKAKAHNPTGYLRQSGKNLEMVLSMVIYPLTMLEASGIDIDLAEPEKMMDQFVSPMGSDAKLLDGSQDIGEKSIGFGFRFTQKNASDKPMWSQMVFVRRSNAVIMVFSLMINGQEPSVQSTDLARKLDARLVEALAK